MAELAAVDAALLLAGRILEATRAGDEARLQHVLDDWALVHPHSHLAPGEHDGLARSLRRALLEASQRGHERVVRVLLQHGAVPDPHGDDRDEEDEGADEHGRSALVCACLGGHIGVVKELLQAGPDVCAKGRLGYTSLVAACSGNRADIVALLLSRLRQQGGGEQARSVVGEALWWCCVWGHEGLACLLLLEGRADPDDATGAGTCVLSPRQVAAQCGQRQCLRVIQWWEGQRARASVLSKARMVHDTQTTAAAMPPPPAGASRGAGVVPTLHLQPACGPLAEAAGECPGGDEEREQVLVLVLHWLPWELYCELMGGLRL